MIHKLGALLAGLTLLVAACSDTNGTTTTMPSSLSCQPEPPSLAVNSNVPIDVHPTDCDESAARDGDEVTMKEIDLARQAEVEERVVSSQECLPGEAEDGFVGGYFVAGELISTAPADEVLGSPRAQDFGIQLRATLPDGGFDRDDLTVLNVFALEGDPLEAARALREDGIAVSPNYAVFTTPGYMFGPANDPVPAVVESAPAIANDGDVRVAVVDTGFDAGAPGQALEPLDGHGLFASGIVAASAPEAAVLEVEVGSAADLAFSEASVFESTMIDLAGNPPDIVNMSLGAYACPDLPPAGLTAAVDNLLTLNDGLLLVAAAGNDGWDHPFWPAALGADPAYSGRVVGVGSAAGGVLSPWSNFGDSAQFCANGQDVTSTYPSGVFEYVDGATGSFAGAAIWSGTSFAAPQVSGAVAAAFNGSAQNTWAGIAAGFPCP